MFLLFKRLYQTLSILSKEIVQSGEFHEHSVVFPFTELKVHFARLAHKLVPETELVFICYVFRDILYHMDTEQKPELYQARLTVAFFVERKIIMHYHLFSFF